MRLKNYLIMRKIIVLLFPLFFISFNAYAKTYLGFNVSQFNTKLINQKYERVASNGYQIISNNNIEVSNSMFGLSHMWLYNSDSQFTGGISLNVDLNETEKDLGLNYVFTPALIFGYKVDNGLFLYNKVEYNITSYNTDWENNFSNASAKHFANGNFSIGLGVMYSINKYFNIYTEYSQSMFDKQKTFYNGDNKTIVSSKMNSLRFGVRVLVKD